MKGDIIILTNLTLRHFCLYWSQYFIAEYMRCQLITTLHFDFSQRFSAICVMFFIGCIEQFHSLVDNAKNIFSHHGIGFFSKNGNIVSSTRKRNYCVLSMCAFAKLKIVLSAEKFLKWTPPLKGTCKTRQCKKYEKQWTMYCLKSVQ